MRDNSDLLASEQGREMPTGQPNPSVAGNLGMTCPLTSESQLRTLQAGKGAGTHQEREEAPHSVPIGN